MNEYIREIVLCGLGFAVGMAVGQFISFRRKGRGITVEVEAKEVWMKIIRQVSWIVVVLIFVASVAQSVAFTYSQRKCNQDVNKALIYRSQLANSDRRILDERDDAIFQMVVKLLTIPSDNKDPGVARAVLSDFVAERTRLDEVQTKIDKLRQDYAIPECSY